MAAHVLTVECVAEQLILNFGNMADVGDHFGVTRQAVWNYVQAHPELKPIVKECKKRIKDLAKSGLVYWLKKKNPEMIRFYLKTKCGFVETHNVNSKNKTELTGKDGTPLIPREESARKILEAYADIISRDDDGSQQSAV